LRLAAALRINLDIESSGIVSPTMDAPSRAPLLLATLLSHYPLPMRSQVRGGQTSPCRIFTQRTPIDEQRTISGNSGKQPRREKATFPMTKDYGTKDNGVQGEGGGGGGGASSEHQQDLGGPEGTGVQASYCQESRASKRGLFTRREVSLRYSAIGSFPLCPISFAYASATPFSSLHRASGC
jgi:hypothetical protein